MRKNKEKVAKNVDVAKKSNNLVLVLSLISLFLVAAGLFLVYYTIIPVVQEQRDTLSEQKALSIAKSLIEKDEVFDIPEDITPTVSPVPNESSVYAVSYLWNTTEEYPVMTDNLESSGAVMGMKEVIEPHRLTAYVDMATESIIYVDDNTPVITEGKAEPMPETPYQPYGFVLVVLGVLSILSALFIKFLKK